VRHFAHVADARIAVAERAAGVSSLLGRRSAQKSGRSPCAERDRWMRGGEGGEGGGRVAESPIRASGICLGASGVGLVQLRHHEDLVVRQSRSAQAASALSSCATTRTSW
jgi:hypothetical protein